MDSCVAVERELEKVLLKFGGLSKTVSREVEALIGSVEDVVRTTVRNEGGRGRGRGRSPRSDGDVEESRDDNVQRLASSIMKRTREAVAGIASEHRELHSTVSKVGKAIDRNFIADFGATGIDDVFESTENRQCLNRVVCEHFCRQGMLDIAEELVKEARLEMDSGKREPFFELNRISESLKQRDLRPALIWARQNRERLQMQFSSLEFKLHRLRFIDLIGKGVHRQTEAVNYARENFPRFAQNHEQDIQVLMGSLLFLKQGIVDSPYASLLEPVHWLEICDIFTRDACTLLGLSVDSPLTVCINAGCTALPALLNIKQVMMQRQVTGVWSSRDELPIEIDLGNGNRYHSIFACPILRQQSSESNPPMRLSCGHVISRDALNKLANANKLKCPYCPVEQSPADARTIHF